MPGLRYGSDFTDDAEMVRRELGALKRLSRKRGLNDRQQKRLSRLRDYIKKGYGSERLLNEFAKYSRTRQGFSNRTRSLNVDQIRQRGYRGNVGRFRNTNLRVRARPAIPKNLLEARARRSNLSIDDLNKSRVPKKVAKKAAKKAKKAKKAAKKAPAKRQSRRAR